MEKRSKPVWELPRNDTKLPDIKLYNSLTNQKDVFRPVKGNHIEWYSCGPTVYDSSHMGHARAYISIDILRRVLMDYFKFDVHFVMNITDIDDKIIKRARQNYLFDKYIKDSHDQSKLQTDINTALNHSLEKISKVSDPDKKIMISKEIDSLKKLLSTGHQTLKNSDLESIKDPLSDWLDQEFGSDVVDNSIFQALPQFYEAEFSADMQQLNVLPPDQLTRVSEFIEPIIEFVERIIAKGLAYESHGSVYFDTEKFDQCDNHFYAKLCPTAFGHDTAARMELLREGEGVLTAAAGQSAGDIGKRSDSDFALWKASKRGEPSWPSPWGKGRPGWHIECSVMATCACGNHLDIHTGGVDLKFPHHDNEIAQTEAALGIPQWVNYFLHTGHLTISGCKMSKSLKNFISIREALKTHSARQLRLMFLMQSWKDTIDYSNDSMTAAVSFEKMVFDFFFVVNHVVRQHRKGTGQTAEQIDKDAELAEVIEKTRVKIHEALCDSIDTREVMFALKDLVTMGNNHFTKRGTQRANANQLREAALCVHEILRVFGAADAIDPIRDSIDLIRYDETALVAILKGAVNAARQFVASIEAAVDDSNRDIVLPLVSGFRQHCKLDFGIDIDSDIDLVPAKLDEFLDRLAELRQTVRSPSISNKWRPLLTACDSLRDSGLASIGVRLQDSDGGSAAAIGLVPVWAQDHREKRDKEIKNKPVLEKKSKKIDASVDPRSMFSMGPHEGLYSQFDEEGVPTHDAAGAEVSKNKRGKMKKLWKDQQDAFNKLHGLQI